MSVIRIIFDLISDPGLLDFLSLGVSYESYEDLEDGCGNLSLFSYFRDGVFLPCKPEKRKTHKNSIIIGPENPT